jgi:sugar phosphate permease
LILFLFQFGGIFGTFICGFVADSIHMEKRHVVTGGLFSVICTIQLLILYLMTAYNGFFDSNDQHFNSASRENSLPLLAFRRHKEIVTCSTENLHYVRIALFAAGIFINGPKTLLPIVAKGLVPLSIHGTFNGIAGLMGQIGASISGIGLGVMLENFGWSNYFLILAFSTANVAIFLFPILLPYEKIKSA